MVRAGLELRITRFQVQGPDHSAMLLQKIRTYSKIKDIQTIACHCFAIILDHERMADIKEEPSY